MLFANLPARDSLRPHSVRPPSKYDRLRDAIADAGHPQYRFAQLLDAVFRRRIRRFADIDTLPKGLRTSLTEQFGESPLRLSRVAEQTSAQAEKILYAMPDGRRIEAVALRFRAGWSSFCISSQAGCGFACSFCSTGRIGLLRNMSADEITDQLLDFLLAGHTLDSVSFMGMGEPLSNRSLFPALALMTRPDLFGLAPQRITVSTIGIVPQMRRLAREHPRVNLTLSLHSPFDEQRSEMMPVNRSYPIGMLMEALDERLALTRRKTYLAYVLIDGVNDGREHARALAALVDGRRNGRDLLHVSLIRYNAAKAVSAGYERSRRDAAQAFHDVLSAAGVRSTIRASFGNDIDAACGQLFARYAPPESG